MADSSETVALHLQGAEVQQQGDGSHLGQAKEVRNVFSIFKYSKMRSLEKNNGLSL